MTDDIKNMLDKLLAKTEKADFEDSVLADLGITRKELNAYKG